MLIASNKSLNQCLQLEPIDFKKLVDVEIAKPARYMGHELGVKERDWDSAKVRWALTYPDLYEIGISNSGHIILYSILNTVPGQLCDRAYMPAIDLSRRLRERSISLFAVESRRPLYAFDILGFSLSYELIATNILDMLDLSAIPLYAADRTDLPIDHPNSPPLIFAGGPTATSNPEPYAKFFDFIALGDGEELLPEIGLVVAESKKNKLSRHALLLDLSEIPGVYVPSLYKDGTNSCSLSPIEPSIQKRVIRRVATPMPQYAIGLVPYIETVHDRLTVEIRRGCTRGCRFCQPGMLTRPARDVDPKEVINAVEAGMKETGYSDFSLLSLSCSDYLALPAVGVELRKRLSDQNISLQLPSQRIDRFNDDIAHILGGNRKAGLTFAPEAGTQRLRDVVNKGLTDADLLKGIRTAMESGYRKVKLYFMLGLPSETSEDVLGIASTCQMLQEKCLDLGRLKLHLTISNFTPKPHTPFQWHSVSKAQLERKQELLKDQLLSLKNIKANFTDIRLSAMEDFIGRGDRRLSDVIEKAWREGAGMDAWYESLDRTYEAWRKAIAHAGLEGKYRKFEIGEWDSVEALRGNELIKFCTKPLPWDHIDTGIDKSWLAEDLQRALDEKIVPDCSFDSCSKCGVCGPELGHNVIVPAPKVPAQVPQQSPPTQRLCRIRFQFSKRNPIELLSHLDILRLFERALRRSQLPVSYSGGFHPLPRLQIALALPLGVEALGEWVDIDFFQPVEAEIVRQKLQKNLPQGLNLINAKIKPISKTSLAQEIAASIWSFNLTVISKCNPTQAEWKAAINSLLMAKELIWNDTDKKGRPRKRNCRPELSSLGMDINRNKGEALIALKGVRMQLNAVIDKQGRSIKPIQIKHWVEESLGLPLEISNVQRDEIQLLKC
ncbi:TIGR03960 family B12-binding radical SAM protein [Prochlorococcus sp. MIT 1307]|uniref:TIGR03960 family B12-binding radical SAM protein n=1 Tax=Prochlorococcus sp. MIT 1307 TaxID=3096219 RepID=UPI002A75B022|nr:TIGR03960 family B12-binding radical SAM protein [Prochlorococcus sp. MIT 1307]